MAESDDFDAFFNAAGSENPLDIKAAVANLLRTREEEAAAAGEQPASAGIPLNSPGGNAPAPSSAAAPSPAARPAAARPAPAPASREKKGKSKRGKRRRSVRAAANPDAPFIISPEHLAELAGQGTIEDSGGFGSAAGSGGKFIAVDPASQGRGGTDDEPFVLIPAHVCSYVPRWGWAAIAAALAMLVAGVVFMPVWSLNRLAARLGDGSEANAQYAMRELVISGDERTVRKLFDMASSGTEDLTARLRAIDTMSLIDGVPEVDRALLRLELAGGTNEQVREAAIAARRQREASRTRGVIR